MCIRDRCIGHLVGLADAAAYDDRYKKWRYEDLPILPAPFRYGVSEEKAAQFHILRSLIERPDVTELVNACDAGREGELIFRLVYEDVYKRQAPFRESGAEPGLGGMAHGIPPEMDGRILWRAEPEGVPRMKMCIRDRCWCSPIRRAVLLAPPP